MAGLRHVATLAGGGQFLTGITDLEIAASGAGVQLYAINRPSGGGLSAFDITGTGAAVLLSQQGFASGLTHLATPYLAVVQGGGEAFLLPVGIQQGSAGAYQLAASGAIGARVPFSTEGTPPADLVAVTQVDMGERSFLVATRAGLQPPLVFEFGQGQVLSPVTPAGPQTTGPQTTGPDVTALVALTLGEQHFVLGASPIANRITSYRLEADGHLRLVDTLDSLTSGIGFDRPVALAQVVLNGVAHVIVAGAGSSSLTVLRLGADGRMQAVEHVIDSLPTRFQTVTALETITLGERVFVLAGGADDGISLFTLLPDGRLIHLSTLADTDAWTLNNVAAIAAAWAGGRAQVFVTSGAEAGISQFTLDLGVLGVTRSGGAGRIEGTAQNDLLLAGPTSSDLRGGEGDDILVGAVQPGGAVQFWGGPGQDIFMPTDGGYRITIRDYEPGVDSIDLTLFPMLRSMLQLQIKTTPQGARLKFGETVIDVICLTPTPLDPSHFTDTGLLSLTRLAVPAAPEVLEGTPAADVLSLGQAGGSAFGLEGDDTIRSGEGNAFIGGGPGQDLIYGGAGSNRIWGSSGNDTVFGGSGTDEIEGGDGRNQLFGNDGNDTITAGAGGDLLAGGAGNDVLYGGTGRDEIYLGFGDDLAGGGPGDDVIVGGAGSNRIWGGLGSDTVYGGTGRDEIFGGGEGRNQLYGNDGDDWIMAGAEGDGIAGGNGNDTLYGGAGADAIYCGLGNDLVGAGAGNDLIVAGAGVNRIYAGFGNDRVEAGTGRDVITGGPGADVFVFASAAAIGIGPARDVITDFTPGTDKIDLSGLGMTLIGGTTFSGSAGQMVYFQGPSGDALLIGDVNGDRQADFVLELTGAPALLATDFIF